jgi:hypothetical protein
MHTPRDNSSSHASPDYVGLAAPDRRSLLQGAAGPSTGAPAQPIIARLMILAGEVYRLPEGSRGLRVVSGRAWLTFAGRDVILRRGDREDLAPGPDTALVSALGCKPLVLEVLGRRKRRMPSLLLAAPGFYAA